MTISEKEITIKGYVAEYPITSVELKQLHMHTTGNCWIMDRILYDTIIHLADSNGRHIFKEYESGTTTMFGLPIVFVDQPCLMKGIR